MKIIVLESMLQQSVINVGNKKDDDNSGSHRDG